MNNTVTSEVSVRRARATLEAVAAAGGLIAASDTELAIQDVLARLAESAEVRRAFMFEVDPGPGVRSSSLTYEWTAPGVDPLRDNPLLRNVVPGG